ncbi:MAG TPA: carboxymuconolactone decarboxylase family protein [Gammaproteobacteria bacterium]|nr:alkylhydroperoxidase [Gammaproteobacteria bacterium]HBF07071.1 carboxymuconolactone decarboxylase family protein [Gammaproteobacteria bacterium]HCK93910.1 carboxymuconolactone decarboxylase family protein [Gammaproteobacteria bacterium]|tara:strand:- start:673 stop:1128 length:456 start_codon:yes stop_codon:yes gene_type:complete
MQERISQATFYRKCPNIVDHLTALGELSLESQIEPELVHLVQLRASQLNNCGFCQHMHAAELRGDGMSQQKLDVLPAWRELSCFSERERAALEWTEALTLLTHDFVSDEVFEYVHSIFGEDEILQLAQQIITINSWNRISVALRFQPKVED